VYARGQGIIVNEPTVIALNTRTQDVLAIGQEAWGMIGRTPGYIVAVRPLRGGAITDFEITQRLIRLLFQQAGVSRLYRARVLICVPSAITHVEQRAVLEAARRAGAAQTYLIEQPMAAAIGASLPIHEPLGNMVIDIGGGTSEVAVISLGGVVALEAVRVGGFDMDAAIQAHVRREYGLAIGERTAEEIKLAIGSAFPTPDEYKVEVRGRDLTTGAPELAQDLLMEGAHLVGGGALLRGFDARIAHECGIPVHLDRTPLETVVLGAGRCLESFDRLKEMFMGKAQGNR
jgi:rod shape-determining protein MreB